MRSGGGCRPCWPGGGTSRSSTPGPRARARGGTWAIGGREADDLRLWLDALAPLAGPDARFAAWGRSMGAATALKAAASDPRIVALVLEAAYHDLARPVGLVLRRLRLPAGFAPLVLRRAGMIAGASLRHPRPIDLAPAVRVPTLMLLGSDDPIAPVADARRMAQMFAHPARILEVAGGGHANIIAIGGEAALRQVADFLAEALGPAPP